MWQFADLILSAYLEWLKGFATKTQQNYVKVFNENFFYRAAPTDLQYR
jgi:hypothetical protein